MKRKGETFAEFLTAAVVFGLIAAAVFEFMANQTQTLANIRDRDNLIYLAQVVCDWNISGDLSGTHINNRNMLHNVKRNIEASNKSTYKYDDKNDKFMIKPTGYEPITTIQEKIVSFDWDKDKKILTIKNNNASMQFTLKP